MTDVVQLDFDRIEVFNAAIGRWKLGLGSPLSIELGDSDSVDAFGRMRVSNAQTVFEAQSQYCANCLRMESGQTGDGITPAHQQDTRLTLLQINPGAVGGSSFHQSFQYLHYQPGKSHLILMTGYFGPPVQGAVSRFGYGDNRNGVFYEQNGLAGVQVTLLSAVSGTPVQNTVPQSQWNIDRLDGSGRSGVVLDPSKSFILVIDLQFLGMGRVRIGFDVEGSVLLVHEFLCANVLTGPYMQTASLPVKAEIIAPAGLASKATAFFKCVAVCSEAGFDVGLGRNFSTEATVLAASGARTHIISLRPQLTFNGFTTRGVWVPETVEILAGTNPVKVEIVIGASFTLAPTFAPISQYSFFEAGTGGTFNNLTSGIVLDAFYISGGGGVNRQTSARDIVTAYPISLNRAGLQRPLGTISVLLTGIGGTSDCRCTINWQELR